MEAILNSQARARAIRFHLFVLNPIMVLTNVLFREALKFWLNVPSLDASLLILNVIVLGGHLFSAKLGLGKTSLALIAVANALLLEMRVDL